MSPSKSAILTWAAILGLWAIGSTAYTPKVKWASTCPGNLKPANNETYVDCGIFEVPLDHSDPDGKKIELFVSRVKANSGCSTASEGLYVELGGPGASNQDWNVPYAENNETVNTPSSQALHRKYDMIAMDMRGSGLSTPVNCSAEAYNNLTWPIIKDRDTYDDMLSKAKAFGQSCGDMTSGNLLQYVGTDQATQDFESLRQALGHEKFNYLGFSYGTSVGSQYAERYPDKVGRMVLDGLVYHDPSPMARVTSSAAGVDSVIRHFSEWCNTTTACALHGRDMATVFEDLLGMSRKGELHDHGLVVPDYEIMIDFISNIHDGTLPGSAKNFQTVSKAIQFAHDNKNGSGFLVFEKQDVDDSMTHSQFAINCADRDNRAFSFSDLKAMGMVAELTGPISNGISFDWQSIMICSQWPTKATNPPHLLNHKQMSKLPPIMLVNSFYDTATYSPWGLSMRDFIPTGVSIYRNGAGHTSWLHQGKTAAAMAKFLVDGDMPEDITVYES